MGFLERIAERVETFYTELAALSLYNPQAEANPARARWKYVQRRIKDGSFFVLAAEVAPLNLDKPTQSTQPLNTSSFGAKRNKRQSVSFDHILSQAVSSVEKTNNPSKGRSHSRNHSERERQKAPSPLPNGRVEGVPPVPVLPRGVTFAKSAGKPERPMRLADAHTARANGPSDSTSYDEQNIQKAAGRMSQFMMGKMKDMRRLSKNFNALSLEHATAMFAPSLPSQAEDDNSSESGSASSLSEVAGALPEYRQNGKYEDPREHKRSDSRQATLEKLSGNYSNVGASYAKPVMKHLSPSFSPSVAGSETGKSARTVMSRSDMHSATFSRKLSVHQYAGSKSSGSISGEPPLPPKPSHW
jgi:hypothetical protein